MSLYVVDGDEQVVYRQLISVAEDRSQRVEAAAALGISGTVVRIPRNPMPFEENLPCNRREIVAHPYHRGICVAR